MSHVNASRAVAIVRAAGGRVVGRTRLQKIAYLLAAAGLDEGFSFVYKHYGPFSEDLATAAREADLLGLLSETEQPASWGGTFSTYVVKDYIGSAAPGARERLAREAATADAIELELAATAAFLAKEGHADPWKETARRKPEKADKGRIDKARILYRKLASIQTPVSLPNLD